MNLSRVSIIVPIYNTEKYLERCLRSIIKQTYSNIEIILVDDGSNDSSLDICRKYQDIDERVIVISGKNQGVSHARNQGMMHANGEFVYFIDSDDYLMSSAVETMVSSAEKHPNQLLVAGYQEVNGSNYDNRTWGNCIINNVEANQLVLEESGVGGYLWNKLFRKSIIDNNNIQFDQKILVWEDALFVLKYLQNCDGMYLIDDIVYAYCRRFGSAVEYSVYSDKLLTQLTAINNIANIIDSSTAAYSVLQRRRVRCCLGLIRSIAISEGKTQKLGCVMDELRSLHSLKGIHLSLTDCISLLMVKIHPLLFVYLYRQFHKLK